MPDSRYRQNLQGEYERLQYLWGEEIYKEHPNWEQLFQWEEELQAVEQELAQFDLGDFLEGKL
jgi:hypothetical protein